MKQTNIVGKCKTCKKNIRNYFYDDDPNEYRECHCKYYRYNKSDDNLLEVYHEK